LFGLSSNKLPQINQVEWWSVVGEQHPFRKTCTHVGQAAALYDFDTKILMTPLSFISFFLLLACLYIARCS
jgi:hypothetical protein